MPERNPVTVQLKDLRLLLRSAAHSEDGASLFKWLYRSWCHSLGAVLSLCFLSEVLATCMISPPSEYFHSRLSRLLWMLIKYELGMIWRMNTESSIQTVGQSVWGDEMQDGMCAGIWACVRAGVVLRGAADGRGGAGAD